jgi:hypothetical protein
MNALLIVLTPIALINSVAILPSSIAGILTSLAARKPVLTASAFIAGKFVPHFAFGLLLAIGLDTAFDQFKVRAQDAWQEPDTLIVLLQLVIGTVMVVFGYHFSRASQQRADQGSSTLLTPARGFTVAAGLTVVGLPTAVFYFAAIDLILRADLNVPGIVKAILFYNVVYLSPLILIVLSRQLFGTRADPLFEAVAEFFKRRGKRLILFGMLGLGIVLMVDAISWFIGVPLLPGNIR